jgi:hypothetical protein
MEVKAAAMAAPEKTRRVTSMIESTPGERSYLYARRQVPAGKLDERTTPEAALETTSADKIRY